MPEPRPTAIATLRSATTTESGLIVPAREDITTPAAQIPQHLRDLMTGNLQTPLLELPSSFRDFDFRTAGSGLFVASDEQQPPTKLIIPSTEDSNRYAANRVEPKHRELSQSELAALLYNPVTFIANRLKNRPDFQTSVGKSLLECWRKISTLSVAPTLAKQIVIAGNLDAAEQISPEITSTNEPHDSPSDDLIFPEPMLVTDDISLIGEIGQEIAMVVELHDFASDQDLVARLFGPYHQFLKALRSRRQALVAETATTSESYLPEMGATTEALIKLISSRENTKLTTAVFDILSTVKIPPSQQQELIKNLQASQLQDHPLADRVARELADQVTTNSSSLEIIRFVRHPALFISDRLQDKPDFQTRAGKELLYLWNQAGEQSTNKILFRESLVDATSLELLDQIGQEIAINLQDYDYLTDQTASVRLLNTYQKFVENYRVQRIDLLRTTNPDSEFYLPTMSVATKSLINLAKCHAENPTLVGPILNILLRIELPNEQQEELISLMDSQQLLEHPLAYRITTELADYEGEKSPWVLTQEARRKKLLEKLKQLTPQECFDQYESLAAEASNLILGASLTDGLRSDDQSNEILYGKVGFEMECHSETARSILANRSPDHFELGVDIGTVWLKQAREFVQNYELRRSSVALKFSHQYWREIGQLPLYFEEMSHLASFHFHLDQQRHPGLVNLQRQFKLRGFRSGMSLAKDHLGTWEFRDFLPPCETIGRRLKPADLTNLIVMTIRGMPTSTIEDTKEWKPHPANVSGATQVTNPSLRINDFSKVVWQQFLFAGMSKDFQSAEAKLALLLSLKNDLALVAFNMGDVARAYDDITQISDLLRLLQQLNNPFISEKAKPLVREVMHHYQKTDLETATVQEIEQLLIIRDLLASLKLNIHQIEILGPSLSLLRRILIPEELGLEPLPASIRDELLKIIEPQIDTGVFLLAEIAESTAIRLICTQSLPSRYLEKIWDDIDGLRSHNFAFELITALSEGRVPKEKNQRAWKIIERNNSPVFQSLLIKPLMYSELTKEVEGKAWTMILQTGSTTVAEEIATHLVVESLPKEVVERAFLVLEQYAGSAACTTLLEFFSPHHLSQQKAAFFELEDIKRRTWKIIEAHSGENTHYHIYLYLALGWFKKKEVPQAQRILKKAGFDRLPANCQPFYKRIGNKENKAEIIDGFFMPYFWHYIGTKFTASTIAEAIERDQLSFQDACQLWPMILHHNIDISNYLEQKPRHRNTGVLAEYEIRKRELIELIARRKSVGSILLALFGYSSQNQDYEQIMKVVDTNLSTLSDDNYNKISDHLDFLVTKIFLRYSLEQERNERQINNVQRTKLGLGLMSIALTISLGTSLVRDSNPSVAEVAHNLEPTSAPTRLIPAPDLDLFVRALESHTASYEQPTPVVMTVPDMEPTIDPESVAAIGADEILMTFQTMNLETENLPTSENLAPRNQTSDGWTLPQGKELISIDNHQLLKYSLLSAEQLRQHLQRESPLLALALSQYLTDHPEYELKISTFSSESRSDMLIVNSPAGHSWAATLISKENPNGPDLNKREVNLLVLQEQAGNTIGYQLIRAEDFAPLNPDISFKNSDLSVYGFHNSAAQNGFNVYCRTGEVGDRATIEGAVVMQESNNILLPTALVDARSQGEGGRIERDPSGLYRYIGSSEVTTNEETEHGQLVTQKRFADDYLAIVRRTHDASRVTNTISVEIANLNGEILHQIPGWIEIGGTTTDGIISNIEVFSFDNDQHLLVFKTANDTSPDHFITIGQGEEQRQAHNTTDLNRSKIHYLLLEKTESGLQIKAQSVGSNFYYGRALRAIQKSNGGVAVEFNASEGEPTYTKHQVTINP
jgi:hypothetical protein